MRSNLQSLCWVALLSWASSAWAQSDTLDAINRYREQLQEGNPAELVSARGEEPWKTKRGPKNQSLESCDLGLGAGVVKGAYARLPRYFADADPGFRDLAHVIQGDVAGGFKDH